MAVHSPGLVHYSQAAALQKKKQFHKDTSAAGSQTAFAAMLAGLQTACQDSSGAGNFCRAAENMFAPGTNNPALAQDPQYAALHIASRTGWYASLYDSPDEDGSDGEEVNDFMFPRLPEPELSEFIQPASQPGQLSARYESGEESVAAIGYDRVGGTSYGTYQISSKAGTMRQFIAYLDDKAPGWARRLRSAGPADTGSTQGRMPREWRRISEEDPARFAQLQHEFISASHYQGALKKIAASNNFQVEQRSKALREVLWSTSVQHGPTGAAEIFDSALEKLQHKGTAISDKKLIEQIYARRSRQFGSSTARVRAAVRQRLHQEKTTALNMLRQEQITVRI
jgi:hypothetical protein